MNQYAGQVMTTGPQAEVWANNFIKIHLSKMPTYDAASALSMANPTSTADANTVATVFKGTTLRSMLLNAYGWWTIGSYALFAGYRPGGAPPSWSCSPSSSSWCGGALRPVAPCPRPSRSPPTARRGRCRRSASPR